MKKFITICIILIAFSSTAFSQNKKKALENVENYIKSKMTDPSRYSRVQLQEVFEQFSAEELDKKLKPATPIKYSLSLTYKLGDSLVDFNYFHLDKDLNVVAVSTKDEMMQPSEEDQLVLDRLLNQPIGNPIDSSETTSTVKMKNFKFKKQVIYEKDGLLFSYNYELFSKEINDKYFNVNTMFPSNSPFKTFGIAIRNYLDTCKSSSVSLNTFAKNLNTEDTETYLSYFNNELQQKYLSDGKINITNLKSNAPVETIVKKKKTVRFPEFTRLVTTYETKELISKTISSFQFDNYTLKNN